MELVGVRSELVDTVWPRVEPLMDRACKRSHGVYEPSDIYEALMGRTMQLWTAWDGKELVAAAVTEIRIYPRMKVLAMPLLAGERLKDWLEFQPTFEEYARAHGCSHLEGYARKGWLRVLKNWTPQWTVIRKEL